MIIQSIKIENFRGIQNQKEFLFADKQFVLLSAPNGLGKTTLIDAIEWCLTGNISRLKNAFDNRSTNENERKKNIDGILKNKNAQSNHKISVDLNMRDGEKLYKIHRTQIKDELNESLSNVQVELNGNKLHDNKILSQVADSNFYNFHFCDVQKSIEIQNRKRKDLPDLFKDFITDYTKEITIAENLDYFADDVMRYKEDLENKKVSEEKIQALENNLSKYIKLPSIQQYPEKQVYEMESNVLSRLEEKDLENQLKLLYKCGYKQSHKLLNEIINDSKNKEISRQLGKIKKCLSGQKKQIEKAVKNGLYNNEKNNIESLEEKISKLKDLNLTYSTIFENSDILLEFKDDRFTLEIFSRAKESITELETKLNDIIQEISRLSEGNEITDALFGLISEEYGLKKYRQELLSASENVKCPVCGSDRFKQIEDADILKEAKNYLEKQNDLIADKTKYSNNLKKQINEKYEGLTNLCNQVLISEIQKLEIDRENLIELKKNTKEFFAAVSSLEIIDNQRFSMKNLIDPDYVSSALAAIAKEHMHTEEVLRKKKEYQEILDLLSYKRAEGENEVMTAQRLSMSAIDAPRIIEFSYPLLVQKINAINSRLGNKEYLELEQELKCSKEINDEILKEQKKLDDLSDKAKKKSESIRTLVEQLKADEYNKVGPNLFKFYKKLSRIHTIEKVELNQENELLSIVDESNKNIVNILSNGQLSVFMLAYFFAGIVSRTKQELFKIYFIDDLTACMDDVNMLAFLDLMKYQLLAKNGSMEQIFFATCDNSICKLLRYKLNGCGVDFCEINEKSFA